MNGKQSKRLRRLAAELKLDPRTKYSRVAQDSNTIAVGPCLRRAYQEAKALYNGAGVDAAGRPVTIAEANNTRAELQALGERSFRKSVHASLKIQPEGPVLK
jgi:hypothetical protein